MTRNVRPLLLSKSPRLLFLLHRLRPSQDRPPLTLCRSRLLQSSRLFTHNSQLLLVAGRLVVRPQLPFLHPPSTSSPSHNPRALTLHNIQRLLLSTETKTRWKQRLRWYVKLQFYLWPAMLFGWALNNGLEQTWLEHEYPTPREWSFWSRWYLRSAKHQEFDRETHIQRVLVNWPRVAFFHAMLLDRLEDEKKDGARILKQGDDQAGILVEGLGETGWDVSMKSEAWRRGYWEALMGAGKAAERLEGMVKRRDQGKWDLKVLVPKECIPGPENKKPRPMPYGMGGPWRPDEVEDAFPSPEKFYLRILTTKGFTSGQRVEAALSYADWCDFKGLHETAEKLLEWGMDIAVAGAESTRSEPSRNVVSRRTGVIDSSKSNSVTTNILKVSTAMGVHFAQAGEIKKALPIFLSILKARKDLPAEPAYAIPEQSKRQESSGGIWPYLNVIKDWLIEAPFPPPPPSGDEVPFHTLKEACEEVGLMTYIGEILYATSSQEKGLSWTRDAVDAAEAIMWVMKEEGREEGKERCQECLQTGLENWKKMARKLAVTAELRERDLLLQEKEKKNKPIWFGDNYEKQKEKAHEETQRWRDEEAQIELRKEKTIPLTLNLRPVRTGWFSV